MRTTLLVRIAIGLVIASLTGCATWRNPLVRTPKRLPSVERELNVARLAERQGRSPQAQQLYDAVLKTYPNHTLVLHRTGVMEARRGRLDAALEKLEQARQSATPSADLLADLGFVQYSLGDFAKAEQTLFEALRRDPNNDRIANNLGLALGIQGRFQDAYEVFQRAGGDAKAHANLAYVRSQLGDLEGAINGYHEALDRDGEMRVAANALVQLDRLTTREPRRPRATRESSEQIALQQMPPNSGDRRPTALASRDVAEPRLTEDSANIGRPAAELAGNDAIEAPGALPPALPALAATAPAQTEATAEVSTGSQTIAQVAHEVVVEAPEVQPAAAVAATDSDRTTTETTGIVPARTQSETSQESLQLGNSWEMGNSATWNLGSGF